MAAPTLSTLAAGGHHEPEVARLGNEGVAPWQRTPAPSAWQAFRRRDVASLSGEQDGTWHEKTVTVVDSIQRDRPEVPSRRAEDWRQTSPQH